MPQDIGRRNERMRKYMAMRRYALTCGRCGEGFQAIGNQRKKYCVSCRDLVRQEHARQKINDSIASNPRYRPTDPAIKLAMLGCARSSTPKERSAFRNAVRTDPCSYCGAAPANGIDHIVPRHLGGSDEPDNWTACCSDCNGRKSSVSLLFALIWLPIATAYNAELRKLQATKVGQQHADLRRILFARRSTLGMHP